MTPHRPLALAIALVALIIPACQLTDLKLWSPETPPPAGACEVECIRGVTYYDGPDADPRHRADLYLPKGLHGYPVVVLVHGGTWIMGNNRMCGLQSSVGEFLARHGIGAILPNYRLSPNVKHPEHVRDVARAFAWTHAHIAEHGGDPECLFLVGHSAGGHLISLLTTDEQYLRAEGLRTADIKGAVALSGVYNIPAGKVEGMLGGATSMSLHVGQQFPFRGSGMPSLAQRLGLPGVPVRMNVFGLAFGDDPHVRADASPVNHVRPGLPPVLLLYAENDLPTLADMAKEFHQALRQQGCDASLFCIKNRNHNSIMFRAVRESDPAAQAILEFIRQHAGG